MLKSYKSVSTEALVEFIAKLTYYESSITIKIWNTTNKYELLRTFIQHTGHVNCITPLIPLSKNYFAASDDHNYIMIWKLPPYCKNGTLDDSVERKSDFDCKNCNHSSHF